MRKSHKSSISLFVFCILIGMTSLLAETPVTNGTLLVAVAANARKMMQYEWKQRISVVRKGTAAEPIVDRINFDSSGQMQRTPISVPQQKETRGLRGKIAAGVKENVKDIMELAGSYNKPQQMLEAIKKAQISQTPGGGAIRLQSNNLIKPTDTLTMLVNPATHLAEHVDIATDYDGSPMTIAQDYSPLPGGPNVMKSMKVSVPQKGIVVNVDSYDYTPQSSRTAGPRAER